MPLPRRSFLKAGLQSAFSVGLLLTSSRIGLGQDRTTPSTQPEIPIEVQKDPVFRFTEETFAPYVGGIFQAPNARGEMIELKLLKLEKHTSTNKLTKSARESKSFSLIFKASAELPPFTSIHTISHPALGKFDLFLTPRKTDQGEFYYEAVINHVQ
jgi:hypothetical protein